MFIHSFLSPRRMTGSKVRRVLCEMDHVMRRGDKKEKGLEGVYAGPEKVRVQGCEKGWRGGEIG